MAKIDLRDDKKRSESGLTTGTVSKPFQHGNKGNKHRGRAETENMIMSYVIKTGREVTRLEICRHLQRAKTPHLIGIIDGLVERGVLTDNQRLERGFEVHYYGLPRNDR